jgi:hypothetical protein
VKALNADHPASVSPARPIASGRWGTPTPLIGMRLMAAATYGGDLALDSAGSKLCTFAAHYE